MSGMGWIGDVPNDRVYQRCSERMVKGGEIRGRRLELKY